MYDLQAPEENLDYSYDWSDFLAESGSPQDSISTSEWSIDPPSDGGSPSSPLLEEQSSSGPNTITSCLVSRLTRGVIYRLTNTVVTTQGRTAAWSIIIRCGQR